MRPDPPSPSPSLKRVLLVGWDGADWKIASPLLDAGELPQLAKIVTQGAFGPLASLPPYLSPMLWNSIATGKYADQHGILGFTTTDPVTGNLTAVTSTQRQCKALWNILSEQGLIAHVIGWFASHPAENVTGVCATEAFPRPIAEGAPWPLPSGAVHPPELADEFAGLRLRPEDVDPAILRLFIPRIGEIDLAQDKRPEQLAIRLAELYSVHNAAIAALDHGPCDFLAVYYHFIDWVCHDFMNFHPPRRPPVPEREFEWYKDVVNSAYRLQDLLLRDLLAHAGADSTVILCSDHGFHSDSRRPVHIPQVSAGIALWHRAQGIFAAAGPGIARDTLVPGATILDVAPTILHLLGLPVGADMDGRVLLTALADRTTVREKITSWENVSGPHPRARHVTALNHAEQAALLEQFAALGYVDLAEPGPGSAAARSDSDNRWNLAITLRHAGRNEPALALLDQLHLEYPEDARHAYHLALCQLHLGLDAEATATVETILDYAPHNPQAQLLLAEIALTRGDAKAALAHVTAAGAASGQFPGLALQRGQALLKLGKIPEAAAALRSVVEDDDENPVAWLAFALALLHAGQPGDAETCARETIALAPTMAMGHFVLGSALGTQEKKPEARAAFLHALELNPRLIAASHALDQLQGKPFVSDVTDITDKLEAGPPVDLLRADCARRRTGHAAALARLRSVAQPCVRHKPPIAANRAHPSASDLAAKTNGPGSPASAPPYVIVSGLPRSGTSLMMQMLARGGLPPMTDGHRAADENNPEGYFEWEDVTRLRHDPGILTRTAGKAVKIVSPLLPHLPAAHRCKIIFMTRPVAEIARSQHRMRGAGPDTPAADAMEPLLTRHADATLATLRATPNLELLTVEYPRLVADPVGESRRVEEFLGATLLPTASAMPAAVQPQLHRQRGEQP